MPLSLEAALFQLSAARSALERIAGDFLRCGPCGISGADMNRRALVNTDPCGPLCSGCLKREIANGNVVSSWPVEPKWHAELAQTTLDRMKGETDV
jgi:hypothetical protein